MGLVSHSERHVTVDMCIYIYIHMIYAYRHRYGYNIDIYRYRHRYIHIYMYKETVYSVLFRYVYMSYISRIYYINAVKSHVLALAAPAAFPGL